MTLEEIKAAVLAGKTVYWVTGFYTVTTDTTGQWFIRGANGHCVGLTWQDGVTLSGDEGRFFTAEITVEENRDTFTPFKCEWLLIVSGLGVVDAGLAVNVEEAQREGDQALAKFLTAGI